MHEGTLHGKVSRRQELLAEVDPDRRARTMRNHTGTHVLHRALRNTLGDSARQAGSLVTPDYLRFDYPFDRGLSPQEKATIEAEVRRIIRKVCRELEAVLAHELGHIIGHEHDDAGGPLQEHLPLGTRRLWVDFDDLP